MTDTRRGASRPTRILAALRELIGALDRRAPQVERPGEIRIARDAQRLRREAVALIEELTGVGSDANAYDQGLVEAIMTDDGGPQPEQHQFQSFHRRQRFARGDFGDLQGAAVRRDSTAATPDGCATT